MNEAILNMILIIFPITMYLVFSCYNIFNNNRLERISFTITIFTSVYLCFGLDINSCGLLIFCNIPVLICYFKKRELLGLIISLIIVIVSYLKYDINVTVTILKYLSYFITYVLLVRRKEFKYLFFKISAVIQGFFISFEYFMDTYQSIDMIIQVIIYVMCVYILTFVSLYLFKLADSIKELYLEVNKMEEENKLRDSLFKLTHEIKNPIAVCKGYLDMINLNNIEKSKKYINIIKSEIDRSLNVITDFMDYSKIKISRDIFDMIMLLDEIYDSFSLLTSRRNIKFNYHNKYEEIYLWGDYDRLKQVFVNVIKNSIESIESNGIIDIDVLCLDDKVKITIKDNGVGMTTYELDNIKEMFYTTKKNGTGLGVALSNEIVVSHNGTMEYISEKDRGTECIITLPL